MNSVVLIGRLTREPELRYTAGTQMAVATFTIAIDRPVRAGGEKQTDFPRVTVLASRRKTVRNTLQKADWSAFREDCKQAVTQTKAATKFIQLT